MSRGPVMDEAMKKILFSAQDGIPICSRPYKQLGKDAGLKEAEVISRIESLRNNGLLKRIDFSLNTQRLGLVSTLVGCRIPRKKIAKASSVIASYGNITHNYLRKHRLNMWFTLSSSSKKKLEGTLRALKEELGAEELVSLPTERLFKLRFRLNALY